MQPTILLHNRHALVSGVLRWAHHDVHIQAWRPRHPLRRNRTRLRRLPIPFRAEGKTAQIGIAVNFSLMMPGSWIGQDITVERLSPNNRACTHVGSTYRSKIRIFQATNTRQPSSPFSGGFTLRRRKILVKLDLTCNAICIECEALECVARASLKIVRRARRGCIEDLHLMMCRSARH